MPEEQLKAFMEKVQGDTSLQEKLKAAADPDAVVTIAKDAGFVITAEEIRSELTDEEPESAAKVKKNYAKHLPPWPKAS